MVTLLLILEVQVTHCHVRLPKRRKEFINWFMRTRWHTSNDIGNILGLSYTTYYCIFVEHLNMRQITAKFVSHLLSDGQKQNWLYARTCIQTKKTKTSFKIITCICCLKMRKNLKVQRFEFITEIPAGLQVRLNSIITQQFHRWSQQ